MRLRLLAAISLVSACTAQAPAPSPGAGGRPSVDDLLDADRAFARAAAERGIEGWMGTLAGDAVRFAFVTDGFVQGHAEIRTQDAALFADPAVELRWEPTEGSLFASGELGFTRGGYSVVQRASDGAETVTSRGRYLTIWRRGPDGWEVILDTGAANP